MTLPNWSRFTWLFKHRVGVPLLWSALAIGAAVTINLTGIHIVGSVKGWQHWLQAQAGILRGWRLSLYATTAWGWWWMRQRVLRREPAAETRRRFLRIEVAAVIAIVLMEGSAWLHG